MPCKGDEPGLERNIEAVLTQDYDSYQTIIVTDSKEDPAYAVAGSVIVRHFNTKAKLCTSELSEGASGKVAALLTGLKNSAGDVEVYAFVDSDARVPANWLGELVSPLVDERIGSTTGFRWCFPLTGSLWSHVEAVWNASGTNLLFDDRYNFPWGGAMALRAETLRRIDVKRVWQSAISDDMTLNLALRKYGYRILFLPQCMVATFSQTSLPRLLKWATRQTLMTKVFNRGLWNYAFFAYAFFDVLFALGLLGLVLGIISGIVWLLPAALLLSPTVLGALRSLQRCRTFERAMPSFKREFKRNRVADAMASFIVPWIMTYCIIKSASTHEIEWRGRKYQLTGMDSYASS
jgi:cellulose synthase/poly-beta-1,6-N-acetylglucosamine synthase-like glycosyltransferase